MVVARFLGLFFLIFVHSSVSLNTQNLAKKFHGVWKVTKVVDNGVEQPLPSEPDDGIGVGETDMMEIIIQDRRLVLVQFSGEGMVASLKVTGAMRGPENRSLQRISIQGIGWQGKRDGPHSAILDVDDDQLKLAFHDANTPPDRISEKAGDQQYVLTAVRFTEGDLVSLLESLNSFHESNISPVFSSSNPSEGHSILDQIATDARVRKIYTLLKSLPKQQAASILAKAYYRSLSKLKESAVTAPIELGLEGGTRFLSIRYAVHANLWLTHQFDSLDNFNRRFSDWNDWYVESWASKKFLDIEPHLSEFARKRRFAGARPEHMLYLNILLGELSKAGEIDDRSEFAECLRKAGMSDLLSKSLSKLRVMPLGAEPLARADGQTEPLVELIVFSNYCGLHNLDVESGQQLLREVSHLLDPNSRHLIDRNWLLLPPLK